jgi:hypothetical protein
MTATTPRDDPRAFQALALVEPQSAALRELLTMLAGRSFERASAHSRASIVENSESLGIARAGSTQYEGVGDTFV